MQIKDNQNILSDTSLKFFIPNQIYQQERLWPNINKRNKGFWFSLYSNPPVTNKYFKHII